VCVSRTRVAAIGVAACAFLTCVVASVSRVAAQGGAESLVALDVRARNDATQRCFEVKALQERIAYYGEARLSRARELRLELDLDAPDSAELRVYRGSALVSRRRFDGLPPTCVDRRDAVALSIALALEGVIREHDPASESGDVAAAAEAASSTSVSGGARTSSARVDASAVSTEPRESTSPIDGAREGASPPVAPPVQSMASGESATLPPVVAASPKARAQAEGEPNDKAAVPAVDAPAALSIRLHLGARLVAAALPAPVFAGVLGAELWFDRTFGVEISALATAIDRSPLAAGHVGSRLLGGEVLGCYGFGLGGLAAQGCAGVLAAACPAEGRDYPVAFPAATLSWVAGTARFALAWPAEESVSLRALIQGHASFVRPVLRVEGARQELSSFWLGGSAGLDLVVAFD
jgi:hypothetical protein